MTEIAFSGDLKRLALGPNDKFILTTQRVLSSETVEHIRESWKKFNGEEPRQILVLDDGMQLSAISETDAKIIELAYKYVEMDEAMLTDMLVSHPATELILEIKKLAGALLPKKG